MPGDYAFNPQTRAQLTRLWGVVTDEDILQIARAVAADPRIGPNSREILDLREVERTDVTRDGIRAAAEVDLGHPGKFVGNRTAIVATRDAHYGMARMYASLTEAMGAPTRVRVFRTVEEAKAWLQALPPGATPPANA